MPNPRPYRPVLATLVGLVTLAMSSGARAELTLTISDGTNTPVTVQDTGGVGQVGVFNLNYHDEYNIMMAFGTSDRLDSPTPAAAQLQINSISITSVGSSSNPAPTLTLTLGDDGFTFPMIYQELQSTITGTVTNFMGGSTAGSAFTFQSYADANDQLLATSGPSVATTGPQSFTATGGPLDVFPSTTGAVLFAPFSGAGSYSLTDVLTFNLSSGTEANLTGTTMMVAPEPSTLMLAGLGAVFGMGFAWRRSRRGAVA